jgi:hypothetical protein
LSTILDRWEERAERRTAHIAALRQDSTQAYATESGGYRRDHLRTRPTRRSRCGIANLADPMLKDPVAKPKAIRDQARADAEGAKGALDRPSITPQALKIFVSRSRRRAA